MMSRIRIAVLFLTGLFLGACAGASMDSLSSDGETWLLRSAEVDGQQLNLSGSEITLSFSGGEAMVGNAAVNKYRAPVVINDGQIEHTGPLITTRMAGSIPAMQLESAYLSGLGDSKTIQRRGETLIISGDGDKLEFMLKRP